MQITSFNAPLASIAEVLSHPTWDIVLLLVIGGGGLFWSFWAGRRKIISAIMLTYIALTIFPALPTGRLVDILGLQDQDLGQAGFFLILFALIVWLLGARRGRPLSPSGPWWQVLLLSFAQAGFLIHIILSFLPAERIALLPPLTRRVFADPSTHLWWLVAPAALLVIIRRLAMREE